MNLKEIFSMEKQLDKIALACTISLFFSIPELPFGSLPFGITSLNQVKTWRGFSTLSFFASLSPLKIERYFFVKNGGFESSNFQGEKLPRKPSGEGASMIHRLRSSQRFLSWLLLSTSRTLTLHWTKNPPPKFGGFHRTEQGSHWIIYGGSPRWN